MPVKTKNKTYKETPKTITSVNELDAVYGRYSYADYLSWKIKERLELIKGINRCSLFLNQKSIKKAEEITIGLCISKKA